MCIPTGIWKKKKLSENTQTLLTSSYSILKLRDMNSTTEHFKVSTYHRTLKLETNTQGQRWFQILQVEHEARLDGHLVLRDRLHPSHPKEDHKTMTPGIEIPMVTLGSKPFFRKFPWKGCSKYHLIRQDRHRVLQDHRECDQWMFAPQTDVWQCDQWCSVWGIQLQWVTVVQTVA